MRFVTKFETSNRIRKVCGTVSSIFVQFPVKMDEKVFQTPTKDRIQNKLVIPPSPFLKTLGFGTGVKVYEFIRSPIADKLRSPWALKKIVKNQRRDVFLKNRLQSEAEVLRRLNHPHIVGFRAYLKSPQGNILAMEECTTSLGDLIENKRDEGESGPYAVDKIMKVGRDISSALNYLHNIALILHCDLKSYNILIKNNFEVIKLCDFGVCLPLNEHGTLDRSKADDECEYIGTPAWTAPEVRGYPQEITSKADIYSFGLVFYEMLTLNVPINEVSIEACLLDFDDEDKENSLKMDTSVLEGKCFILPDIDVGEEYNIILEIMHRCASRLKEERPEASELEVIFQECFKKTNSV